MSQPSGRRRTDPNELAKQIAERLAESSPSKPGFSWRNSVIVGYLIAGLLVLPILGGVAVAVVMGVNWILDQPDEPPPGVAAPQADGDDGGIAGLPGSSTSIGPFIGAGDETVPTVFGPIATTTTAGGPVRATLPPPTTSTTPSVTPTTAPDTTTTAPAVPTTEATTTSSSPLPPTTLPPTTTTIVSTTTTIGSTTTTVPPVTTTTVPPVTTTTVPPVTTTTLASTTTAVSIP